MYLTRFLLAILTINEIIFPNISIANINVSGKSVPEASTILSNELKKPSEIKIRYNSFENFVIPLADLDLEYDYLASTQRAYHIVKSGNIIYDIVNKIKIAIYGKNLGLIARYDTDGLKSIISVVSGQIDNEPIYPSISIVNKKVEVNNGKNGVVVDTNQLISKVNENIAYATSSEIELPIIQIDPTLNDSQVNSAISRAEKLIGKKIEIKHEFDTVTKIDKDLIKFLDPAGGFNQNEIQKIVNEVSLKFDREPQNPKFIFSDGKVTEFQPSLNGIKTNKAELYNLIEDSINNEKFLIELPVFETVPKITTDKVNNLGIKELIGRGTSTYFHSIPGRVHNVSLATNRINGTLVAPNETFSFNQALGDVSKFTGYKSAYVILNGKTVLGDGGGVCQVSSTLFRAVLNAGLPIDQRVAHAYRVGYYEQGSPPGLDATVYAPSPDFKFTNNTGNHILITAKADPKNYSLIFEIYGTSDGRIAEITKPIISNSIAPPPDVYQDDPSLPVGTIKQVEYRAYGAKVSFNYLVTRNGEELFKKTFVSNYRPWSAVFLRGTKIQ